MAIVPSERSYNSTIPTHQYTFFQGITKDDWVTRGPTNPMQLDCSTLNRWMGGATCPQFVSSHARSVYLNVCLCAIYICVCACAHTHLLSTRLKILFEGCPRLERERKDDFIIFNLGMRTMMDSGISEDIRICHHHNVIYSSSSSNGSLHVPFIFFHVFIIFPYMSRCFSRFPQLPLGTCTRWSSSTPWRRCRHSSWSL